MISKYSKLTSLNMNSLRLFAVVDKNKRGLFHYKLDTEYVLSNLWQCVQFICWLLISKAIVFHFL